MDDIIYKCYPIFHYLGTHVTGQAHHLIKELYIVYVPKFNPYGSIYSVLFQSANSMVMYHRAVGTHLGHDNYIYTKLWKIHEKPKIKDLNSSINE